MKHFRLLILIAFSFISSLFVCGCSDRSSATYENLKYAIDNELRKQIISIPIAGSSVHEETTDIPFVIIDPTLKANQNRSLDKHMIFYLNKIVSYAHTLENSGALKLTEATFTFHKNFVGSIKMSGYQVEYNQDLTRTMTVTPYLAISSAQIGSLEVRDFVKTTNTFMDDGKQCIDVTFNVKLTNVLECINDDVLFESGAKKAVSNCVNTYRLYLDESNKEWRVLMKTKTSTIDPVATLYKRLISESNVFTR